MHKQRQSWIRPKSPVQFIASDLKVMCNSGHALHKPLTMLQDSSSLCL